MSKFEIWQQADYCPKDITEFENHIFFAYVNAEKEDQQKIETNWPELFFKHL